MEKGIETEPPGADRVASCLGLWETGPPCGGRDGAASRWRIPGDPARGHRGRLRNGRHVAEPECERAHANPERAHANPERAHATPSGPVALEAGFPDAGTYTTTAFQPRLTVQIDDGWQVLFQDDEDELALEGDSGDGMIFLAGRVSQVVGPAGGATDAPDDLIGWLRGHPSLKTAVPAATTVDSQPATSIDVTNESDTDIDLFFFPTGSFHIPPGVRLRFTVVPMDGPDLVFNMGGPVDQFEAAMARTKPMLDSLQIGD